MLRGVVQMDEQSPPPPVAGHDDTPALPLTREARVLLEKASQGGVPMYTTANLARIAEENGISVSPDMTPNQVIEALRRRS